MRTQWVIAALTGLSLCTSIKIALADAKTITLQGKGNETPACITCHGAHGEGMSANGFPRLAGLNADYLKRQLDAFAKGERNNPMMTPIAKTLNEDDRVALANYYAGLGISSSTTTTTAPTTQTNAVGVMLALKGRWSQDLPACVQCHGAMGSGVGTVFPALAGQSANYIENQLHAWQQGQRAPGPLGLMKVIASKLSSTDIKEVANYFAALPPYVSSGSKP